MGSRRTVPAKTKQRSSRLTIASRPLAFDNQWSQRLTHMSTKEFSMNRQHLVRIAFAILVLIGSASAIAQDDVLKTIPSFAYGVAYVKEIGQANSKITKLVRLVGQQAPDLLGMARLTTGLNDGVNTKGSLAVALLPGVDGVPTPVIFVPTTDFQALLKQFKPEDSTAKIVDVEIAFNATVIAKKGDFAVIASAEHRSVVEAVLKSNKAIYDQVESLREFLSEADFCLVVNRGGIQLGMGQTLAGLQDVKASLGEIEGALGATMGIEIYESLFKAIRTDVTQFAITAKIDEDGTVRVASRTIVSPESDFAALAKSAKAPLSNPLKGLPSGPFVAVVGGSMPEDLLDAMMKMSVEMMRGMPNWDQLNDEQMKKIGDAAIQVMRGVRSMNFAIGVGKEDEPLYSRMHFTLQTDDATAYLESYAKVMVTMSELTKESKIPFYGELDVKKITIDQMPALEVTSGFASLPGANDEVMKEVFQQMFGGDKMRIYLAAADKTTVVGAYVSKAQLMRALKSAKSGLSDDEQIAVTAKMLPADAHWVMYFSPQGSVDFVKNVMSTFAPAGAAPDLPRFPNSPPIGFSAKLTAEGLETEMVAPAATLKAIGEFAKRVAGGPGNLD
jgi:hypothetical protein